MLYIDLKFKKIKIKGRFMILKILLFMLIFIFVKNLIIRLLSKKLIKEITKKDFNLVEKIKAP